MTDQDFTRILNAVDGYWPTANLKDNARKAWRHQLAPFAVDEVLEALSDYAAEGHPFPPMAGQLAARISPPQKRGNTESEIERVRRQRAEATQLVKAGKMSQADFDFYAEDYWNPVEAAHKDAA